MGGGRKVESGGGLKREEEGKEGGKETGRKKGRRKEGIDNI